MMSSLSASHLVMALVRIKDSTPRYTVVEHRAIPGSGGHCMECELEEYCFIIVDMHWPVPLLERGLGALKSNPKATEPRSLMCLCEKCLAKLGIALLEAAHR